MLKLFTAKLPLPSNGKRVSCADW